MKKLLFLMIVFIFGMNASYGNYCEITKYTDGTVGVKIHNEYKQWKNLSSSEKDWCNKSIEKLENERLEREQEREQERERAQELEKQQGKNNIVLLITMLPIIIAIIFGFLIYHSKSHKTRYTKASNDASEYKDLSRAQIKQLGREKGLTISDLRIEADKYFLDKQYNKAFNLSIEIYNNNPTPLDIFSLVSYYSKGYGVEINHVRAFELCKEAATLGLPIAMSTLSLFYENGIGTNQNREDSEYWEEQAIKVNSPDALYYRAYRYFNKGNMTEAFKYCKKSAELSFVHSFLLLGIMYLQGKGVTQNTDKAIEWLEKSAYLNDSKSIDILIDIYNELDNYDKVIFWNTRKNRL